MTQQHQGVPAQGEKTLEEDPCAANICFYLHGRGFELAPIDGLEIERIVKHFHRAHSAQSYAVAERLAEEVQALKADGHVMFSLLDRRLGIDDPKINGEWLRQLLHAKEALAEFSKIKGEAEPCKDTGKKP